MNITPTIRFSLRYFTITNPNRIKRIIKRNIKRYKKAKTYSRKDFLKRYIIALRIEFLKLQKDIIKK